MTLAQSPDVGGPAQPLLTVRGLTKHFPLASGLLGRSAGSVQAVDDVSFTIAKGETLGVVGESGCGKSTTSRLIMALMQPTAGEIIFDGQSIGYGGLSLKEYRRQVQMVFQDSYSSLNPRLTVQESIAFAPQVHGVRRPRRRHPRPGPAGRRRAEPGAVQPPLPARTVRRPGQRVNIARALALQPRLLILDEPVSALDKSVEAQVLNLLLDLKAEFGLTYLFISHDLNVVQFVADRVLVMYLGRIAEIGPVDAIFAEAAHPYNRRPAGQPALDGPGSPPHRTTPAGRSAQPGRPRPPAAASAPAAARPRPSAPPPHRR